MLKLALRNLASRPARSVLSLLGLTVAIAGMVGLFSVAEGLEDMVDSTFDRIPGLVAMQYGAPIPLFSSLPAAWGDEIAQVPGVHAVNREIWQRVNVIDGERIVSPPRFLCGTDLISRSKMNHEVYSENLIGRFLTPDDVGTTNCVISRDISEEFSKGLGDTLVVNGEPMPIVGIYHCGSMLLDVAIILDIGEVRKITRFDPDSVSAFYIEPTGDVPSDMLTQNIENHFAGRDVERWTPASAGLEIPTNVVSDLLASFDSQLKGGSQNPTAAPAEPPANTETAGAETDPPIEVRDAQEWGEQVDKFSADLNIFLGILTSIGLTIAVLSIINTMLMSVAERIIEFGILKANGWSRRDVLKLITFESAILGLAGGLLGASSGWTVTTVLNNLYPDRVHLFASPPLLVFSIVFATVLGIVGGLYPAFWAMRMMPMDAIRRG